MASRLDRLAEALKDRYTIERELGAGGMATVYLADDPKHHRKVALKVLRPDLAATLGPERFLREVTIAANLQHPHILPVYDSGEVEGFLYYVMPYVEGESLRDRLAKHGELPLTDAVRILRNVADAMAAAHAKGVVHRDIKPENVMLSGRHALVTDFGVAKAVSEATGRQDLTTPGVALGTPAYMAPEQAAADPHADHRADIYAFGVMAYEMLTGQPPFVGPTPQAVLAAHVTEAPVEVTQRRPTVPAPLAQLVMRCLAKKPADRAQTAEELLPVLEALATPSGSLPPTQPAPIRALAMLRHRVLPLALAAAVILVGLVGRHLFLRKPITIVASAITQVTSEPGVEFQPAISPDGKEVAYVVGPIRRPRIVVRSTIDIGMSGETRPGNGVDGPLWAPSWTPNGASLRFCAWVRLPLCDWYEVGKLGGSARTVSVPRRSNHYAWSLDDAQGAFTVGDSIFAYSVGEDASRFLGVQLANPWEPHSLTWSPDGHWIAYVNRNPTWRTSANVSSASIWILESDGGTPIQVTDEEHMNVSPQWLPDSRHLLFVSDRDGPRGIYEVMVGRDGPVGEPRSVLPSSDPHSISISRDGKRLAFSKLRVKQNIWMVRVPQSGVASIRDAVEVTTGNQVIERFSLSPDEAAIVFNSTRRGNSDIYAQPLSEGTPRLIADMSHNLFAPAWSPEGSEIAFSDGEVYVVSADGGRPEQLTDFPGADIRPAWSPDGLSIAFETQGPQGGVPVFVWTMSRDGVGMAWHRPVQLTDFPCYTPDWAPDGSHVLCRTGQQIVVVSRGGQVISRLKPGMSVEYPQFSADGSGIYFRGRDTDGSDGVWWVPAGGEGARKVVAFDDPSLAVYSWRMASTGVLYLTISQYESDIWAMDLTW